MLKRILCATLASGALVLSGSAAAQELKIALIAGKTGPLEAYAKDKGSATLSPDIAKAFQAKIEN